MEAIAPRRRVRGTSARILTPADYEARKAEIRAEFERESAKAASPMRAHGDKFSLWSVIETFDGTGFTHEDLIARVRKLHPRRKNRYDRLTTLRYVLMRLVEKGALRRLSGSPGIEVNRYQVTWRPKLAKAEARRQARLAQLEREWRASPFSGMKLSKAADLPQPDSAVLQLRYAGWTLERIGERLGVSRQRVAQLQARAFERLKEL